MAKVIPLLLAGAIVAGCTAPASRPSQSWDGRTADFLWSTIEPANPYPVIHLPAGGVSVYQESAAAIALSRLDTGGLSDAGVAKLVRDLRSRRDPATGLIDDDPPVSGAPATWNALRALEALGRHDVLDGAWQRELLRAVAPVIDHPAKVTKVFDRVEYFRIGRFLVQHGERAVSSAAARALAGSPAGRDCAVVRSGADVDLWAAQAEIAAAAGATCPTSPDQEQVLRGALDDVLGQARRDGQFSIATIERLRTVQLLHRLQGRGAGPLGDALGAAVTVLQREITAGRIEARPVPLADASEVLAVAGRHSTMVPVAQRLLQQVLTWGAPFTTFKPSAPLFLYVARTLLVLEPSHDTAERLAGLVHWPAVQGIDRLALASQLRPALLTAADVRAGIRQAGTAPRPPGPRGLWRRLPAAVAIAQAARLSRTSCDGHVRAWMARELARIDGDRAALVRGSPEQLMLIATLVRVARSCPGGDATTSRLVGELRTRAPGQLDLTLRRAQAGAGPASLGGLRSALELSCMTATPVPAPVKASVSTLLARMTSGDHTIGVVDSAGRFLPEETFALVRSRQLIAAGCDGGG